MQTRVTLFSSRRSSLVESILVSAQRVKRGSFRVIVVDSLPGVEGRQLADTLSAEGVPCTYVLLTAISYIMRVRAFFFKHHPCCKYTNAMCICECIYTAVRCEIEFRGQLGMLYFLTKLVLGVSSYHLLYIRKMKYLFARSPLRRK